MLLFHIEMIRSEQYWPYSALPFYETLWFGLKITTAWNFFKEIWHYGDVMMGAMASQITSLTIVNSTVCSGADQRKHQSSASLAFVWGIHRWPVNSPHKWPVTRKMLPFHDVIIRFVKKCHAMVVQSRVTPVLHDSMRFHQSNVM